MSIRYLHVLHEELEHVAQPCPDDLIRLAPPPIPNVEKRLRTSRLSQAGQHTSFSCPTRTSFSKLRPQPPHENS